MQEIKFIHRKTQEIIPESPPGENYLKFLYHTPFGRLPLNLLVRRKLLSSFYGKLMNKKSSQKRIMPFVKEYNINMDEALKSVDEFSSFNDFFYRKLKPSARKVEDGLVSPADGKILAFENAAALNNFFVKGNQFTINGFLQDEQLAKKYENAALVIVRLAPNDYHRFHFPYTGIASAANQIDGKYYSVSPYALAKSFAKVFCENKREYTILSTQNKGDVLISPVGATMVGTIIETYQPNSEVQKGDEMGYFAFGGSSILMLIEQGKFEIDKDILENTRNNMETSILMGEKIGK